MIVSRSLPASQRHPRRWRSGGGITHDIALYPAIQGISDDDFFWRASLASVTQPCDFSRWPNVTRHLLILSGTMQLSINGQTHHITNDGPELIFSGDDHVHAVPLGNARVFNLMLRHGRAHAVLRRQAQPFTSIADHLLLLAPATRTIMMGQHRLTLEAEDAYIVETPNAAQLIQPDGALITAKITLI
jgi:uncharacterized protein